MTGRIHTNSHGHSFHIGGRNRPIMTRETHPHMYRAMAKFLTAEGLPTAPDSFDYSSSSLTAQSMILANGPDSTAPDGAKQGVGDCTSCARSHIIDAATANAGSPIVMSCDQTLAFYGKSTGYVIGDESTDRGGDEVTVLTTWRDQGATIDGHAIVAYMTVDGSKAQFAKDVLYTFGNLYYGMELADPWLDISGPGFTWDVGAPPNPNNGHAVPALGADARGTKVNTWGRLGTLTWAANAQFTDEASGGNLFVVLTQDIINRATQKAPNGIDWDSLLADINALPSGVMTPVGP
jgi:hypothetical protein